MKTPKNNAKPKATSRKAVTQAIAKQDIEQKVQSSVEQQDIHEAIRLKAYELYVERGHVHGNDIDDWVMAEQIVRQRLG